MKYSKTNQPLVCMMTNSTCYKGTTTMQVKGILWHSTGANNPKISRYVQPYEGDANYNELINILGKNKYGNDWNHIERQAGLNAWIGKLADGSVSTVQTMPWNYRPWGCGAGAKGSCNDGWIQFEIAESDLTDKTYFDKVYKEACELTAYLCDMYGIDPNGTVVHNGATVPTILCHYDSYKLGLGSNHGDVLYWFKKHGKTMDNVRNDVKALMQKPAAPVVTTPAVKEGDVVKLASDATYYSGKSMPDWVKKKNWIVSEVKGDRVIIDQSADGKNSICSPVNAKYLTVVNEFTPYMVQVTATALNVRADAGTNHKITGVIKDKGTYTIIGEKTVSGKTWGLLKSKLGWISLAYTKRV